LRKRPHQRFESLGIYFLPLRDILLKLTALSRDDASEIRRRADVLHRQKPTVEIAFDLVVGSPSESRRCGKRLHQAAAALSVFVRPLEGKRTDGALVGKKFAKTIELRLDDSPKRCEIRSKPIPSFVCGGLVGAIGTLRRAAAISSFGPSACRARSRLPQRIPLLLDRRPNRCADAFDNLDLARLGRDA
jgi:hypothetical protein